MSSFLLAGAQLAGRQASNAELGIAKFDSGNMILPDLKRTATGNAAESLFKLAMADVKQSFSINV